VLEAGHCATRDLGGAEAADSSSQHVDWTSHVRMLVQQRELFRLRRRFEDHAAAI
jgi:hypothetical protein